jgi:hypothetical protein
MQSQAPPARRALLFASLLLACLACAAPSATAATYRGGGEGIEVELRVAGDRIVFAQVTGVLHCIDRRERRRRTRRFGVAWNSDRTPPVVTEFHLYPIDLAADGSFRDESGDHSEAGFGSDELFAGRVRPGAVAGRFSVRDEYRTPGRSELCQTGGYPGAGEGAAVRFRARRR